MTSVFFFSFLPSLLPFCPAHRRMPEGVPAWGFLIWSLLYFCWCWSCRFPLGLVCCSSSLFFPSFLLSFFSIPDTTHARFAFSRQGTRHSAFLCSTGRRAGSSAESGLASWMWRLVGYRELVSWARSNWLASQLTDWLAVCMHARPEGLRTSRKKWPKSK